MSEAMQSLVLRSNTGGLYQIQKRRKDIEHALQTLIQLIKIRNVFFPHNRSVWIDSYGSTCD